MCPVIDNPTRCKIRTVIRFLHAKNMNAAENHHELCAAYGENVTSEVRQWYRNSLSQPFYLGGTLEIIFNSWGTPA
jgi:hypothetical protein